MPAPTSAPGPVSTPALVDPVHTEDMTWIPTGPGKSFRPLRFEHDGWSELMRLEPGSVVARHRHTGEVHAYNLSGTRQMLDTAELIGEGDYVYEPPGTIDAWQAVGDEPCVVHIKVVGAVEYLDSDGNVIDQANSASQRATYLAWCHRHGVQLNTRVLPTASTRERSTDEAATPPGRSTPI